MNAGLTSVVALAQFGLTTGFPALPIWRQENIAWIFLIVCGFFRTTDRLCCVMLPCTFRDFCEWGVDQCVGSCSAWADDRISCSVQLTTGESRLVFSLRNEFSWWVLLFCTVEKKQFVDFNGLLVIVTRLMWFQFGVTQVSIALGDFVALCSIRRWVSWTLLVWSLLVMVTSMDVLMCFQADVLLEILRVRVSGQVKMSRPSLGDDGSTFW